MTTRIYTHEEFEAAVKQQAAGTVKYALDRPMNPGKVKEIETRLQAEFGEAKGVMIHRHEFGLELTVNVSDVD
jgi:hypothetical protein